MLVVFFLIFIAPLQLCSKKCVHCYATEFHEILPNVVAGPYATSTAAITTTVDATLLASFFTIDFPTRNLLLPQTASETLTFI